MRSFFKNLSQSSTRAIISILVTLNSYAIIYILIFKEVPEKNKEVIIALVGVVVGGSIGAVMGYNFGSSKDKSDSDKQDKLTITNPNVAASVTAPNTNDTAATK